MRTWLWILTTLIACSDSTKPGETGQVEDKLPTDEDGDGYPETEDCDDGDASVHPDAAETCDGRDEDCDDVADDGLEESTTYADSDGDGFGDDEDPGALGCDATAGGRVSAQGDCDDSDASTNPNATETCNGADDDCDGLADDLDDDVTGTSAGYLDSDRDGFGDDDVVVEACELPESYSSEPGDCDDADSSIYPGAPEEDCTDPVDYNCDGTTLYADEDGDGWPACEECDDRDRTVNPDASEACNATDDDCDGEVDESDATDADTWYTDADGDGSGDPDAATTACTRPDGAVSSADDCDDTDADVHLGATETCNGVDDDCNGATDEPEAVDASTWYADADGDGHGDASVASTACDAPSGTVASADDCDDGDPEVFPDAAEICNFTDDDCDDLIDDADDSLDSSTATTWTYDFDGDGFGGESDVVVSCEAPTSSYVSTDGDCDDTDAAYRPDASEGCDGNDYDCDGAVDNDADGDGYADAACGGDDCDDSDDGLVPEPDGGCALGESCADILARHPDYASGTYTIDVDGFGTGEDPREIECDMETHGGGWSVILSWDDETGSDDAASFQALMTEEYNNMTIFGDKTDYIRWADDNATADVLSYRYDFTVPNGGEAHFIYSFYGHSMDDSATFFYVQSGDTPHNLACHDNVTESDYLSAYSSTEQSYLPDYTCTYTTYGATYTWDEDELYSFGETLDAFYIRAFMYDSYGDYGFLYHFALWVR